MRNFLLSGAVALALSFGFSACKKDKDDPQPAAPVPAPIITSLSPTSGQVGAPVIIVGTDLAQTAVVTFNGTVATFTINNSNSVTAMVPAGATTGNVTVTTPTGTSNGILFTVVVPPTTRELLTTKTWMMTAATEALVPAGSGPDRDIFLSYYNACERDDLYRFETSGAYTRTDGLTQCGVTTYQGTWGFNTDQTKLTITTPGLGPIEYTLLELTTTTLKYQGVIGTSPVRTYTFTAQ